MLKLRKKSGHNYFKLPNLNKISKPVRTSCLIYEPFRVSEHLLGKGSYGHVLIACKENSLNITNIENCKYVAKIVTFNFSRYESNYVFNLFFAESIITKFAGDKGFGIPVKGYSLCDPKPDFLRPSFSSLFKNEDEDEDDDQNIKGVVVMDRYDNDLETDQSHMSFEDFQSLFEKIKIMHSYGILHRDLFTRNIMYKITNGKKDIRIIDFGLSIPLEKEIPGIFKAIDYLRLISGIENLEIKRKCKNHLYSTLGKSDVDTAIDWITRHSYTCLSEYNLLKLIPEQIILNYGPATVDLLVWSSKCNKDLDNDIVDKTNQRVRSTIYSKSKSKSKTSSKSKLNYSKIKQLFYGK